ncbi:MAG: glycosyltransferase family 4 protein [Anaerolineales bacterium]|nr:glycosyltransferase family 4 protein [Anaerolineales bacterium]
MRLLILAHNTTASSGLSSDTLVVPFSELRQWFKSGRFFLYLLRFQYVELSVYDFAVLPRPFLSTIYLRLLSRGKVIISSSQEQKIITIRDIIKYGQCYLTDLTRRLRLLSQIQNELNILPTKISLAHNNLTQNPIYLYTDLVFNLQAGGSLGHIAGVLNNLGGHPIFFTTDHIHTVAPDIEKHIVPLSPRFWDFPELPAIASNTTIAAYIQERNSTAAFIYQRYSLYNYVGVKLATQWGVPLVLEYNGSEVWIGKHWGNEGRYSQFAERIEDLNLNLATLIVVVSQPLKEELVARGVAPDKILVNPNGVEPTRYSPTIDGTTIRRQYDLDGKIVIGFIGTFGPWHGAEVLADAFGLLLKQYPVYRGQVRLLLIGDGIKMPEVRAKIDEHGTAPFCSVVGTVPQHYGPSYLAACDILASPHVPNADGSKFFGSPTKLFEYMAMGKGIVASNLEQIGEVLQHNQTAYLVTPGDPDALVEGLKALIDDAALRTRLGEAARQEVIANYTWQRHTEKIMDKLERLCGSSAKS